MKKIELLGIVSFCVLMGNREGILGKAPSYIAEKYHLIKAVPYMWSALDSSNQGKVLGWGRKWGVDFASLIKQIGKDYWDIPAKEFQEKYFVRK